jgi:AraC family L-rhamnose operon transcriptional activator RhaR
MYAVNPLVRDAVRLHSHEFHEFVFVQAAKGDMKHRTPEGAELLRRGDVFVIVPGARHGYSSTYGLEKTDLFLQTQWLSEELRLLWWEGGLIQSLLASALFDRPLHGGIWRLRLEEGAFRDCEQELSAMVEELKRPHGSLAFCIGSFFKLLSILNRAYEGSGAESAFPLDKPLWLVVARIEEAIARGDALDPEGMAGEVAMSRRHLDRRFRDETGLSISEYYRNRRIQHAARLLTEGTHTVKQIAHRLNFSDAAHFVRVFKDHMGVSPGAYRSEHEAGSGRAAALQA